jgi:hypothetical protein
MPGGIEGAKVRTNDQRRTDNMSANATRNGNLPTFRSGPLITGGSLVATGALIALAGVAVGSLHVLSATRQWVGEMEVPPSELAKIKWAQAKSAAAAGTAAWQNGASARDTAGV